MVGRINQVSFLCHHEAYKSDAHSILVEEDVGMGAVELGREGEEEGTGGEKKHRGASMELLNKYK